MAATKIRVELASVEVHDDADLFGPGEWRLTATVRRLAAKESIAFGDPKHTFEASSGSTLAIGWSTLLDIKPSDTEIEIKIEGVDEDLIWDDDLGWVRATLNIPIVHDYDLALRSSKGNYTATLKVQVMAQSGAAAGAVTTIVQRSEANTYNTLHDEMLSKMVHICPVIPVPWTTGIPPLAKGVQGLTASPQVDLSISSSATRLNALVNPSLIPVLNPADAAFANQCARIRITQFRPSNLDLNKLIWKAATSNIKLWDGTSKSEIKGGQEVSAYGVLAGSSDEEGCIEVRWDSEGRPLLAVFKAWVGKPKYIWTRANVIKTTASVGGVPVLNPTVTPSQILAQINYNNIVLWQSGILMVVDTDKTTYNGAVFKQDGIFEITSATNYTFNVTLDAKIEAPLLNSRQGVFNVAYLHTCAGFPTLNGAATDRRLSGPEGTVSAAGSPSTSWVRPTGVFPDDDAQSLKMKQIGPSPARANAQKPLCGDGAIEKICGCVMTQQGATLPGTLTLAHELGHVLGLHHRGSGGQQKKESFDGVNHLAGPLKGRGHPWDENLMTYGPNTRRQDLDFIQTSVVRTHKLLKDGPPPPPSPPPPPPPTPPPPKAVQPIPAEWLASPADITLLQEYLSGKRAGLKHFGYVLGMTGPDADGVDGVLGPKTKAAIAAFQSDHGGLKTDGIYGPKTKAAFDEEINGP